VLGNDEIDIDGIAQVGGCDVLISKWIKIDKIT
jgi:hypothetical protein